MKEKVENFSSSLSSFTYFQVRREKKTSSEGWIEEESKKGSKERKKKVENEKERNPEIRDEVSLRKKRKKMERGWNSK